VLYGLPNKSSEEVKRATPLTSTPKTGSTGSTDNADSTHNHNLEMIIGTVAETNRKLDSVLGKLGKLDQIESALGNIVKKVDMLETKVKVLEESSFAFFYVYESGRVRKIQKNSS
jgi:hypothetical protein